MTDPNMRAPEKQFFYFEHKVDHGWVTVADLVALLAKCPPHAMVCAGEAGHVLLVVSEPFANEPFVLLSR